ncbi:MAG TPA: pilus assembly protein TadG-related protein [Candidatus Methylacidiphilales bacterium]|jgi:Flp pilus assembly protein TadG|nr:pilus assembly protein TadG-related protein [Candidatus Methylacidiphilales bacterium]
MQAVFGSGKRRNAQTLVFFLLAWGTIMLLCGLAIDSGLLYLAKARLGRAVDGAALEAVGNFNQNSNPTTNRDDVALIMRNFAAANFTDLSSISTTGSTTPGGVASTTTGTNGQPVTIYTYNFNDGTQDANGQYRRFVQVVLTTGSGGAITSATCNARCPVQTYFIGYATYAINGRQNVKIGGYSGPSGLVDLKVSSEAIATRNPRLIMIVIDRSASMLAQGGGASGLPPAVVQFLDFFDTSSDNIGIVSFGTSARLEMPLTTNFIIAGTNNLIDAYETNDVGSAEPGIDPEDTADQTTYDATGVRRLKFGGSTCADDGIRLAMEQLMANSGFNDPDVIKYMVIFTDGKWNTARTLFAAPGYTNEITCPLLPGPTVVFSNNGTAMGMTNGQDTGGPQGGGPWSTNLAADTNLVPVPSLGVNGTSLPFITNAIATSDGAFYNEYYASYGVNHTNDTWQSADTSGYETLLNPNTSLNEGAPMAVTNTTWVGTNSVAVGILPPGSINYYTHNVDVWLQPGSVAFYYTNAIAVTAGTYVPYVSDYTNPTKHINLYLGLGGKIDLVVPGYIADGTFFDGLDLCYPDNSFTVGSSAWPRYRADNFQQPYMWEDDPNSTPTAANNLGNAPYTSASLERQLMFRNYVNLLTGFYVSRPDYPLGTATEPLITDSSSLRAQDPLGPYYPGAAFYWPFGGNLAGTGDVTGADGIAWDPTYALINPLSDPGVGEARHNAYSINMLSTNAAPEWAGELFYDSISGGGTNNISGTGTTSASQIMQSANWQNLAPAFVTAMGAITGLMTNEPTHDTNIVGSPSVWRPLSFNGVGSPVGSVTPGGSATGGYVSDGNGHIYADAMAWSGRPTHYFDFTRSRWVPVSDNHDTNIQALPLGNWKAEEYAWHARALGVTIYTVGYGTLVTDTQQAFLAEIANATNTTAGGGSNISFNPSQPIGQQFYATNAAQISNDFYSVGQAINAALTGGG